MKQHLVSPRLRIFRFLGFFDGIELNIKNVKSVLC